MAQLDTSSSTSTGTEATSNEDISEDFLHLVDELNLALEQFSVPDKVKTVYNPTIYARKTFEMYVRKYCNTTKPIIYVGISPGPWGMSQTGVPFGEIESVRDWLQIEGPVDKPNNEIKARPIKGFNCTKSEISGQRFWGLFKSLCKKPEKFFESSFLYNYSPQQWMDSKGGNITPEQFKKNEVQELYNICDRTLSKVLELYKVEKIVAIGGFAETRVKATITEYLPSRQIEIFKLHHPSPLANRDKTPWEEKAMKMLNDSHLLEYYIVNT